MNVEIKKNHPRFLSFYRVSNFYNRIFLLHIDRVKADINCLYKNQRIIFVNGFLLPNVRWKFILLYDFSLSFG